MSTEPRVVFSFNVVGGLGAWCDGELARLLAATEPHIGGVGCLLWNGDKASRYGRKRFGFPGRARKASYVHRIAYQLSRCVVELPTHLEVSHLCHQKRCIFPPHLTLEERRVNQDRRKCMRQNLCTKDHAPYCILD